MSSHRGNLSFTKNENENIIRNNELLKKRIQKVASRPSTYPEKFNRHFVPSSYINRMKRQQQILSENERLLRRIYTCSKAVRDK